MKTKLKIIILSLIFVTCNVVKKKYFPEILNSDEKVVYLEGHDKSSGLYSFYYEVTEKLDSNWFVLKRK